MLFEDRTVTPRNHGHRRGVIVCSGEMDEAAFALLKASIEACLADEPDRVTIDIVGASRSDWFDDRLAMLVSRCLALGLGVELVSRREATGKPSGLRDDLQVITRPSVRVSAS